MWSVIVVDGSGYVFRAYYGLPELHSEGGHNINAIFWFFRMILRLLESKPSSFGIARDSPTKTLRKQSEESYKSNRTKMPDDLKWQMGMIQQLVDELWIGHATAPWYEADDIIATLAMEFDTTVPWSRLTIASSDKDLKQLLRPHVIQVDAMKNQTSTHRTFEEEYGFEPKYMLDYLSLLGDASDNIPWVRWIGKKGAQSLISQYGSIDEIYRVLENTDEIWWSVAKKLIEWKELAFSSRDLVELMKVPEMSANQLIADWNCTYDFDRMKHVLVDQYKFASLERLLTALKKKRQWWEQHSLFG